MKRANKLIGFCIESRNVGPFEAIAMHATSAKFSTSAWPPCCRVLHDQFGMGQNKILKAGGSICVWHRLRARPGESDRHSDACLLNQTLQPAARFGLDRRDQITHVDVAVELTW